MSERDWKAKLIDVFSANPTWLLIALGLAFLFLATAGWPPRVDPSASTTRILFLSVAALFLLSGGIFFFKKSRQPDAAAVEKTPPNSLQEQIIGRYRAEKDLYYINTISSLGGELFRIENKAWDGVGFFDGKIYYGIFKYNDKDEVRRGIWGAHKAQLVCQEGQWRLEVQGWEMKIGSDLLPWGKQSDWFKEG